MTLNATCIACIVKRQVEGIAGETDETKKLAFMKDVLKILYENADTESAPVTTEFITAARRRYFGEDESFQGLKQKYNQMMLDYEEQIYRRIEAAPDPLAAAVQFARTGNYIDFGAMGQIDDGKLNALLQSALDDPLDPREYAGFTDALRGAKRIAYLTDNCGEIVMDKLLMRTMKQLYPDLQIDVIVRGKPVINDATLEDAERVGIGAYGAVWGNGTGAAGTDLKRISPEAEAAMTNADFIIAKGQGNFESLHGCGRNIFYLFLCKCDWFVSRFGVERYKGVMTHESSHQII